MKIKHEHIGLARGMAFLLILILTTAHGLAAEPIKIGLIQGLGGPLDVYARQEIAGFKLGLEHATQGTHQIIGRDVILVIEETQSKPDKGVALLAKLYEEHRVALAVGPTSSAVALACLPVAKKFKKILIVEPAVADSITGAHWNRYIFRTGGNILPVLKGWKRLEGMVGATYYYYASPKNPVNDWLVKAHLQRFKEPPDFFTCGGFASAMAVVKGIRKAQSTDTEKLIAAMEGMEFMTPKGKMIFRKEDHQALQTMFSFRLEVRPDVEWAVPVLVRELSPQETAPPIMITP
jgi:branched-chain amino acid transport system substrate-binding protein